MGGLLSRLNEEKSGEKSGIFDSAVTREITGFERLRIRFTQNLLMICLPPLWVKPTRTRSDPCFATAFCRLLVKKVQR